MTLRALLQQSSSSGFTPEETTGIIVGFCVVGFILLGLAAYAAFLTGRLGRLEARLAQVEAHPKLLKLEPDA